MIGINPLRTPVLITSDEVIFHAPTDHQVDPRHLLQSIIVAERRFIKPMLTDVPYNALTAMKNKIVTALNISTLQSDLNTGRDADREQIVLVEGDMVNSDTYLDAISLALWKDYLHKITAECVYYVSLPVNRARFTSQGIMVNNPASITSDSKSQSIDLKDLKHLMDRTLQDRISPLVEDMHKFLCTNGYPGYANNCQCDSDGHRYIKQTDVMLGMYDEDDRWNERRPNERRHRWDC